MIYQDVFTYITEEEQNYLRPIQITENYQWSMYKHVMTTVNYKNSVFNSGPDDNKPFKNIIRPILNLAYRAEGFDVKDIVMYIDDQYKYFKSFLVKKYHEKWARENEIDTFIDDLVEAWITFGGVLVKDVNSVKPEVVPWQRIAFVDQTDVMSGPICERHYFSSSQLKDMEKRGWENVDKVITLARKEPNEKNLDPKTHNTAKTPGKYIEIYELHGLFPRFWLYDRDENGNYTGRYLDEESRDNDFIQQVHIVAYYQDVDGMKRGLTLYKSKETKIPYKFSVRDAIFGRALGMGGAEELFEPQVWTNYSEIQKKNMLDAASKTIFQTTDPAFANRNKIQSMDNLEITVVEDNKRIDQIDTRPLNIALFDKLTNDWFDHARLMGAANEAITGDQPPAGTPFKLQELVTAEAHSLHEYRKGKLAIFVDEIYRDWIIPHLAREITKGNEFLSELDLTELQQVSESLVMCVTNDQIKEKILNGQPVYPEEIEALAQQTREEFMRGGNQRFIKILKGEMKDAPMSVRISIAGKQKNLSQGVDKLVNIFRQIVANPQVLQSPPMAKLFNQIIEQSGLDPIDFTGFTIPTPAQETNASPELNLTESKELAQTVI